MGRNLEAGIMRLGHEVRQLALREQGFAPEPAVDKDLYAANPQHGAEFLTRFVLLVPGPKSLVLPAEGEVGIHSNAEVAGVIQRSQLIQPFLVHEEFGDAGPAAFQSRLDGFLRGGESDPFSIANPVGVGVDEPGKESVAGQVHGHGPIGTEGEDFIVRPDGHDSVACNGDGLRLGRLGLHRQDRAIEQDEIRRGAYGRGGQRKNHEEGEEGEDEDRGDEKRQ